MNVDRFSEQPLGGIFSLDVQYQDVAKASHYRARFHAAAIEYPTAWAVVKIDYWAGTGDEPDFTVTLDAPI